jgi:hypothetical protein
MEDNKLSNYKLKTGKVGEGVISGYKKIENGVVDGYRSIENGVVKGYEKIENKFVGIFIEKIEDEEETPKE